jgi:hypothetical protein
VESTRADAARAAVRTFRALGGGLGHTKQSVSERSQVRAPRT